MNICRKCGAVLRDGDKYCSKCGARASGERAEARRQNALKKKQQKEITFRTKPAHARGYRENFEEGENRTHALLVTVTILVVMMLAVAAFAMFYFLRRRSMASGGYSSAIEIISEASVAEESAAAGAQPAADAAAQGEAQPAADAAAQNEAQPAADTAAQSGAQPAADAAAQSEAQPAADASAQSETQPPDGAAGSETPAESSSEEAAETEGAPETEAAQQTEAAPETEAEQQTEETEKPSVPSAAEVIDTAQIQSIIDSESTAYTSEVYIYDLRNDSEAALGDCTEPMYASALITVPILYTAASRIDSGEMSLDEQITYVTSVGGRGEMTTEIRDGLQYPLSFYLQTMVNYSDNNCINTLIDYIGLDTINATCQAAGYSSVNMERGIVADNPGGLDNYVSAKDVTMMVKDLYTGTFSSIGTDFMKTYFHISEGDSMPTLVGLAPDLADAAVFLNQNGQGMTRYNETAVIEDGNAAYILTIMLYGDSGMVYSPAVTDIAEYVSTAMAG